MTTFVVKLKKDRVKNAVGIVVPETAVEALGAGRKPAVKVTVAGYTYRSTVATMGGRFMIGLSAAHREASGLKGDEEVEVTLEVDREKRTTEPPADLKAALRAAGLLEHFGKAAPSRQKEFVRQVEEAKTAETRARRIAKVVEALKA